MKRKEELIRRLAPWVMSAVAMLGIASTASASPSNPVEGNDYDIVPGPNPGSTYIKVLAGKNVKTAALARNFNTTEFDIGEDNMTSTLATCENIRGKSRTSEGIRTVEGRRDRTVWATCLPPNEKHVYILPTLLIEITGQTRVPASTKIAAADALKVCTTFDCVNEQITKLGGTPIPAAGNGSSDELQKELEAAEQKLAIQEAELKALSEKLKQPQGPAGENKDGNDKPAPWTAMEKLALGFGIATGILLIACIVFLVLWLKARAKAKKLAVEVEELDRQVLEKAKEHAGSRVIITSPPPLIGDDSRAQLETYKRYLGDNLRDTEEARKVMETAGAPMNINPGLPLLKLAQKLLTGFDAQHQAALSGQQSRPNSKETQEKLDGYDGIIANRDHLELNLKALRDLLIHLVESEKIPVEFDVRDPEKSETVILNAILKHFQTKQEGWTATLKQKHEQEQRELPLKAGLMEFCKTQAERLEIDPAKHPEFPSFALAVGKELVNRLDASESNMSLINVGLQPAAEKFKVPLPADLTKIDTLNVLMQVFEAYESQFQYWHHAHKRFGELFQELTRLHSRLADLDKVIDGLEPNDPDRAEQALARDDIHGLVDEAFKELDELHRRLTGFGVFEEFLVPPAMRQLQLTHEDALAKPRQELLSNRVTLPHPATGRPRSFISSHPLPSEFVLQIAQGTNGAGDPAPSRPYNDTPARKTDRFGGIRERITTPEESRAWMASVRTLDPDTNVTIWTESWEDLAMLSKLVQCKIAIDPALIHSDDPGIHSIIGKGTLTDLPYTLTALRSTYGLGPSADAAR